MAHVAGCPASLLSPWHPPPHPWRRGPLPLWITLPPTSELSLSIFTLLLLYILNIRSDNHRGCLTQWSALSPRRTGYWFDYNDLVLSGMPQPCFPQASHVDARFCRMWGFPEMDIVDPHYERFRICEFACSLKRICNIQSNTWGACPVIRTVHCRDSKSLSCQKRTILAEVGEIGALLSCFSSQTRNKCSFHSLFSAIFFAFLCFFYW